MKLPLQSFGKSLLFVLAFGLMTLVSLRAHAQVEGGNSATVNYVVGDLEKLDKLELTKIYIAKLNRLYAILPYLPFAVLEPKAPNDLKIPSSSANEKGLEKMGDSLKAFSATTDTTMSLLIPYANKDEIIYAVLFLQSVINKIELVGLGMSGFGFK